MDIQCDFHWFVSQTVWKLEPCKEKNYFAKMHIFIGIAKLKWAMFLFKLMPFLNEKKIALPDWRQMKVLSKGFKMV